LYRAFQDSVPKKIYLISKLELQAGSNISDNRIKELDNKGSKANLTNQAGVTQLVE
jgi:hypothetical protein